MTMTRIDPRLEEMSQERLVEYFQGAVIDENGREHPITREMIQEACRRLEQAARPSDVKARAAQSIRLSDTQRG